MVLGSNISGPDEVGMQLKATPATHKATARTAVVPRHVVTRGAFLRGMPGRRDISAICFQSHRGVALWTQIPRWR